MARCAFCDADFETGPGDVLLVCPYCGTAQTIEGAKFKNHYMIRVHFAQHEAQAVLLDWLSKQLGVPEDLAAKARFVEYKQVWYPFWVSRVDAHTEYHGLGRDATFHDPWPQYPGAYKRFSYFWKPESGKFIRRYEIKTPGIEDIDEDIKNFPIPTRANEYFSHSHAEEYDGVVLHSKVSEEQAKEFARKKAYENQTALILQEVDKIERRDDNIDVGETFLIHIPVWELTYRYGNSKYRASVSASTGYVIESKYPRSMAFRAMGIVSGLLFLGIGGALIAMANGYLGPQQLMGFGNLTGGILFILGLVLFYKGVSRKEAKEKV